MSTTRPSAPETAESAVAVPALPLDRPGPLEPPPAYAELRLATPVTRVHVPGAHRAWLVTSYDAVVAVLTDRRFGLAPPGVESSGNDTLFQDGAAHARLRRLVAKAFTPKAIAEMRPHIEHLAAERATAFAAAGPPADLVAGFAAPLSAQVIGDLLGVAIGERERFHALAEAVASVDMVGADAEAMETAAQAWMDLTGYVGRLVEAKRQGLGDDLLSALIRVRDAQDGRLSEDELIGLATTLVTAGYQTARNAITAGTLQLLTTEGLPSLAGEPSRSTDPETPSLPGSSSVAGRAEAVVEEVLRRLAGLIAEPFPRWAHEALDLGGASIEAGDLVLVRLEAANHDPRYFAEPDRFLPERGSTKAHVSFGRGPHHCVGAALARIELTAALVVLAKNLPGLRLAIPLGDLTWNRGLSDAGPKSVPVTW